MQERAKRFVPCADEVHYLHKRAGPECDFFRGFSEEGHYKGRGRNETRQGIYCVSPSGRFLASVNSSDPARVIATDYRRASDSGKRASKKPIRRSRFRWV